MRLILIRIVLEWGSQSDVTPKVASPKSPDVGPMSGLFFVYLTPRRDGCPPWLWPGVPLMGGNWPDLFQVSAFRRFLVQQGQAPVLAPRRSFH